MYCGELFRPDSQAPEVVQPRKGPLDDPPGLSEATAARFTVTGNVRSNAGGVQWSVIFFLIVSAIGLHDDCL